jgi:hypothetical protein
MKQEPLEAGPVADAHAKRAVPIPPTGSASGGEPASSAISDGYILLARVLEKSEIMSMPLPYRWTWITILMRANHSAKRPSDRLDRGQLLTTLADLADACSWQVGHRKMGPSRRDTWRACEWLRERKMITTAKTTCGLVVTICNYDKYQTPGNYERDNERPTNATRTRQERDKNDNTIDKNGKNGRMEERQQHPAAANDAAAGVGLPAKSVLPKPKPETAEIPPSLQAVPEFTQVWAEWIRDRAERKKPLTHRAATLQLRQLVEWGPMYAVEVVRTSMANQWQGLFPPKGGNGRSPPAAQTKPLTLADVPRVEI